jgi:hypothetical protein
MKTMSERLDILWNPLQNIICCIGVEQRPIAVCLVAYSAFESFLLRNLKSELIEAYGIVPREVVTAESQLSTHPNYIFREYGHGE